MRKEKREGMIRLNHIVEATSVQLEEVVRIVDANWEEIGQRPLIKKEVQTLEYWERVHRNGRIFLYQAENKVKNNDFVALLSLIKDNKNMVIDFLYIAKDYREQEITIKMLRLAEIVAANWTVEQITWLFYCKEELESQFPLFQRLGYVLHCPMDKKGFILLEKKVV